MIEYVSSISPKGQITIPQELRRRLGMKPKDKVAITLENGGVKIMPAKSSLGAVYQAVPALTRRLSVDEMIELAHEEQAEDAAREGLRE